MRLTIYLQNLTYRLKKAGSAITDFSAPPQGNELGMSFQFVPTTSPKRVNGVTTWTDGQLISVDPVAMAAFEGTSAVLNSATYGESARSAALKIHHAVATSDAIKARARRLARR